jgi:hypothetical protein
MAVATTLALAAPDDGRPADAKACSAWRLRYALSATLHLSETPMGAGDGTYAIGPGEMVLVFDDLGGKPGGSVRMTSYKMRDHFVVSTRALFLTTTVTTRTNTRATPNAKGIVAQGTLGGEVMSFGTKVSGYRTDGTLTCKGALCGTFGAPPAGTSELHIGPNDVQFKPLTFSRDLKRLSMPKTFVSKTSSPKQVAHVQLRGREVTRGQTGCD